MPWPHVLTVAGSDSGAGAGIQADLKACAALGAYCSTVITAVTAQNTAGVQGVHLVPEEFIREQLNSVLSDMSVDVVKTGMLPSAGIIQILCESLRKFPVKALVVDPVMVSTSGDSLSDPSTLTNYRDELFAMADIVTPNVKEASKLLGGVSLHTVSDMRDAAASIYKFGPRYVLVKGGDMPDLSEAIDVFYDGKEFVELRGHRIKTRNTHGTGCTLASSIAAELAKGSTMLHAVQVAKNFVESALHHSEDLVIGNGPQGPFDHLFRLKCPPYNIGSQQSFNPDSLFLYAVTDSRMNKKWGHSIQDAVTAVPVPTLSVGRLLHPAVRPSSSASSQSSCTSSPSPPHAASHARWWEGGSRAGNSAPPCESLRSTPPSSWRNGRRTRAQRANADGGKEEQMRGNSRSLCGCLRSTPLFIVRRWWLELRRLQLRLNFVAHGSHTSSASSDLTTRLRGRFCPS